MTAEATSDGFFMSEDYTRAETRIFANGNVRVCRDAPRPPGLRPEPRRSPGKRAPFARGAPRALLTQPAAARNGSRASGQPSRPQQPEPAEAAGQGVRLSMRSRNVLAVSLVTFLVGSFARPASAQFYQQRNIVSDGAVPAERTDQNLVNAWGLTAGPATPWWISDNGADMSTILNGNTGAPGRPPVA